MDHITVTVVVSADNQVSEKVFHLDGAKVHSQLSKQVKDGGNVAEALVHWVEKGIEGAHLTLGPDDETTNPAVESPKRKRK